jgi:hypothetical protein
MTMANVEMLFRNDNLTTDTNLAEAERTYYHIEMPKLRKAISDLKAESGAWGRKRRILYFHDRIFVIQSNIRTILADYERLSKVDSPYIEKYVATMSLPDLEKELGKMKSELKYLENELRGKPNHNSITPEMIEAARQCRIENLIEVKKGKALCPFHDDHNPSMSIKNNRYHCFACRASGDVIDFVMKRENMSFKDAVKFLA